MMNYFARALVCAAGLALALAAVSDEGAPTGSPPAPSADDSQAKGWSQTRLLAGPELRIQIESTETFLAGLTVDVGRLKAEGAVDRRSFTEIRTAIDHAHGSIMRLSADIEAQRRIDGEAARLVSYELGLAADALVDQAKLLDGDSTAAVAAETAIGDGSMSEAEQRQYLAARLRQSADLLKGTARHIVAQLD